MTNRLVLAFLGLVSTSRWGSVGIVRYRRSNRWYWAKGRDNVLFVDKPSWNQDCVYHVWKNDVFLLQKLVGIFFSHKVKNEFNFEYYVYACWRQDHVWRHSPTKVFFINQISSKTKNGPFGREACAYVFVSFSACRFQGKHVDGVTEYYDVIFSWAVLLLERVKPKIPFFSSRIMTYNYTVRCSFNFYLLFPYYFCNFIHQIR